MALRAHHLAASFLIGAIILSSLAVLTVSPNVAHASCPTGSTVFITTIGNTTGTISGGPLSGVATLQAQSTTTAATGLSFMLTSPAQQSIGEATQSGSNWTTSWDTRNQPNGSYQLIAIAHYGTNTNLDCASAVAPVVVNNTSTQPATLYASISPNTWEGRFGTSAPFSVDALYVDQYGRQTHVTPANVNWHSTLGTAAPNGGSSTVFTAGTAVGSATLLADVTYGGLVAHSTAQIKVTAPTTTATGTSGSTAVPSPTPKPATTTSTASGTTASPSPSPTPVSAADATRLAAMPTIFRPATPTNADPVVNIPTLSCLEKAIGTLRFSEISSGTSQPTAAERKLAAQCFSGAEPIPAILAPVAPSHLTELDSTTNVVTLSSIKNQTTTSKDGKKVNGLLISGTGAPNTNVFIYVFSDPLVLRAETDSKGAWSYVLENPLKTGNHEVYAVAEKDAGNFVRTSAVPISVAAATNGTDGSLVIQKGWSTAQIGFIAGASVLVIAAIGIFFSILRRRKSPAKQMNSGTAPEIFTPNNENQI